MTSWEPGDEVEEALRALRVHDAGRERAERTRVRCVAVLEARRKAEAAARGRGATWRAWLEPAFAMGLGALYLAEAIGRALAVYR
jgi:fatty acid desaturase